MKELFWQFVCRRSSIRRATFFLLQRMAIEKQLPGRKHAAVIKHNVSYPNQRGKHESYVILVFGGDNADRFCEPSALMRELKINDAMERVAEAFRHAWPKTRVTRILVRTLTVAALGIKEGNSNEDIKV